MQDLTLVEWDMENMENVYNLPRAEKGTRLAR